MLTIKEIREETSFKQLEREWNSLLQCSTSNNVFLTYEWISVFWETFRGSDELFVLTIIDERQNLVGIAPFKIRVRKKYGIKLRSLEFIGGEKVASEYLDFIFCKGKEQQCLEIIVNYLISSDHWDLIDLFDMNGATQNVKILQQLLKENKFTFEIYQRNICPYIELPKSWDEYLNSLSRNNRHSIRRRTRALYRDHKVGFFFVGENKENLNETISKYFELQKLRIEDKGLSSIVTQPEYKLFHKKIIKIFQQKGWLCLAFLAIEDDFIACIYGYKYNNKFYHYQGGFDPKFKRYGIATLLTAHLIEKLINNDFLEYDFLRGDEAYKFSWTSNCHNNIGIKVCKKNHLIKLIYLMDYNKRLAKQKLKLLLGERRLAKVKKILYLIHGREYN